MARILEIYGKQEAKPSLPREENAGGVSRIMPYDDSTDEEISDVPFIEVGAPAGRVMSRALQSLEGPAIIPIPRPALKLPPVIQPESAAAPLPYFQISFQPLPLEHRPLASVEHRFARELVAFHAPDHPVGEQYHLLARELESQLGIESQKSLLFASAMPGAGMTSVVLNLAITLARRGTRVVVVDACFARPAVAERLGIAAAPGLKELLARTVPLPWAIQDSGLANLGVVTTGKAALELQASTWQSLLDQLGVRADWVLIDAGCWSDGPYVAAFTASCSAAYLILRRAEVADEALNKPLEAISSHGGRLRGYVLVEK
jgi:Mrp family chromosome partitioning ATPase